MTSLYVSTALETWETSAPEPNQDAICERSGYRRLEPEYYAWLRCRMEAAKRARTSGRLSASQYGELRRCFNAVHLWATKRWSEEELLAAIQSLDARSYRAPEIQYEQRFFAPCKGCEGLIEWIEDLEHSGRWIPMRPARHERHIC